MTLSASTNNKGIRVGLSVGLTILAAFLFAIAYYRIKSRRFRNSFRPKRGLSTSFYTDSPSASATKTLGPWIKSNTDGSQTKNLQGFRPDDGGPDDHSVVSSLSPSETPSILAARAAAARELAYEETPAGHASL